MKTYLYKIKVNLSDNQKKISKAFYKRKSVNIRLKSNNLFGKDKIIVPSLLKQGWVFTNLVGESFPIFTVVDHLLKNRYKRKQMYLSINYSLIDNSLKNVVEKNIEKLTQ